MSDAVFSASIVAALDRFTVPALPSGFAERLLARLESGVFPIEALDILPPLRRPMAPRRWLRPGRLFISVALLGVASATAAASGAFGDPIYVPVVSEALARADIVALPVKPAAKPKPKVVVEKAPALVEKKAEITGPAAVRALYKRLRADDAFRALPPHERAAVARKELSEMLRAGTVKPDEIRVAMREMREERLAKQPISDNAPKPQVRNRLPVPPEVAAQRRAAIEAMPAEDKQELIELRRQLREASLEERPAIRRKIREILRDARDNSMPAEGEPEPAR